MSEEKKGKIDALKTATLHSGIATSGVGLLITLGLPLKIGLPAIGMLASFMLASGLTWIKYRE